MIWFGIEDAPGVASGGFDWAGLALITPALGLVMGGLIATAAASARPPCCRGC